MAAKNQPEWLQLLLTTWPCTKWRWVLRAMFYGGIIAFFTAPDHPLGSLGGICVMAAWMVMQLGAMTAPDVTFARRRVVQSRIHGMVMLAGGTLSAVIGLFRAEALLLLVGLLLAVAGLFFVLRRPHRPDLGDRIFSDRTEQLFGIYREPFHQEPPPDDRPRDWWTGDVLPKDGTKS